MSLVGMCHRRVRQETITMLPIMGMVRTGSMVGGREEGKREEVMGIMIRVRVEGMGMAGDTGKGHEVIMGDTIEIRGDMGTMIGITRCDCKV